MGRSSRGQFIMDHKRPATGRRAALLAAALFAITLNLLQPLAHAVLARDAGPLAASLWKSMCLSAAGEDDGTATPQADGPHECCLGLASAPVLPAPTAFFVGVRHVSILVDRPMVAIDALQPVGIRDGPSQPHGPPRTV
jgi:hypothetical protein